MDRLRRSELGRALLLFAIVAGSLIASPRAHADERLRAEAERRNKMASRYYQEGRYESALQLYQSAYDLVPDPKFLFNIALAKEKTFDYEGCTLAFQEYLERTRDDTGAAARDTARTRLEHCLSRTVIPVRFTSVPTNAAIYIGQGPDKALRGRTPQELELAPGQHHVTVELPGYVTQEQDIQVEVGKRPRPDFVLEKLSSLTVEVDPSGARVKVDDSAWQPAPMTRQVRAGVHLVKVQKKGYEPARREVKVEAGREVSLVLSLRPLPNIRKLAISTRLDFGPTRVEVDGEPAGAAPVEARLSPGRHQIRVTAPGRLPYHEKIQLPEDRDLRLLVDLRPRRSKRSRYAVWGLVGATGLAAAVGSTYGILALSDQAEFNDDKTDAALHARGERRAERADLWLGSAAILAAGTVLYYYLSRPEPSSATLEP